MISGVGYATQVVVFLHNIYYNVILAWGFYYLFASFTSVLPWSHCNNQWNTPNCKLGFHDQTNVTSYNVSDNGGFNITTGLTLGANLTQKAVDPVTEYWE